MDLNNMLDAPVPGEEKKQIKDRIHFGVMTRNLLQQRNEMLMFSS